MIGNLTSAVVLLYLFVLNTILGQSIFSTIYEPIKQDNQEGRSFSVTDQADQILVLEGSNQINQTSTQNTTSNSSTDQDQGEQDDDPQAQKSAVQQTTDQFEIDLTKDKQQDGCQRTQNGCKCKHTWGFNPPVSQPLNNTYQGCANPDEDSRGNWCVIDRLSCNIAAGANNTIFNGQEQPTKDVFDYCVEGCPLGASKAIEMPCMRTLAGCSCLDDWRFTGYGPFTGCHNPDDDERGGWCIVDLSSCDVQKLSGEVVSKSTGDQLGIFDYCGRCKGSSVPAVQGISDRDQLLSNPQSTQSDASQELPLSTIDYSEIISSQDQSSEQIIFQPNIKYDS
eukprot:TRINITY_DN1278_c0_g1_i4.p3 TRINITY_DN1278_c0_g1~~TRINITY_DN1278_c0_g1_i4.p3  ORF type:complete len:337 (+),score=21.61 TRINITY_DN1278_c0_g1_i4:89-1099(+)